MSKHSVGYTIESALNLARSLKYGPLPKPEDPVLEPEEALDLIREERRTCGFNWLTGEAAEEAIMAYLKQQEESKRSTANNGNAVLPELKKGDVLFKTGPDGRQTEFTVIKVGKGTEFDEPVYFLSGMYGVKLRKAYTGEELSTLGYGLKEKG